MIKLFKPLNQKEAKFFRPVIRPFLVLWFLFGLSRIYLLVLENSPANFDLWELLQLPLFTVITLLAAWTLFTQLIRK